jgi:hypothetical protein
MKFIQIGRRVINLAAIAYVNLYRSATSVEIYLLATEGRISPGDHNLLEGESEMTTLIFHAEEAEQVRAYFADAYDVKSETFVISPAKPMPASATEEEGE